MKIRFLETYTVKAQGGATYQKDDVLDFPEPTARHFLQRGRAEVFVPAPEPLPVIPEPVKEIQEPQVSGKEIPVLGIKPRPKSRNRRPK